MTIRDLLAVVRTAVDHGYGDGEIAFLVERSGPQQYVVAEIVAADVRLDETDAPVLFLWPKVKALNETKTLH